MEEKMAKKATAVNTEKSFDLDLEGGLEPQAVRIDFEETVEEPEIPETVPQRKKALKNCLRNERVIVRHINRPSSITDPRHVCFGRMHENSKCVFTVPILSSGNFVNVLTNDEKAFLEDLLGVDLSVYKKKENFWDESTGNSLASVTLEKGDNILDLSKPDDFIRYKLLLSNKNLIAPSYEEYQDHPKASYLYYITSEQEESKKALDSVGRKSQAYMKLGELTGDIYTMRIILELLTGRPTSKSSKEEFLKVELSKCIEKNSKEFIKICGDEYLSTKAFIKQCHEAGLIYKKGDWYYLRSDNTALCGSNEEPTLTKAAKYLHDPKNQDILFSLQAKLKA